MSWDERCRGEGRGVRATVHGEVWARRMPKEGHRLAVQETGSELTVSTIFSQKPGVEASRCRGFGGVPVPSGSRKSSLGQSGGGCPKWQQLSLEVQ